MRTIAVIACWLIAIAIAFGMLTWTFGSGFLLFLCGISAAAVIGALLMLGKDQQK